MLSNGSLKIIISSISIVALFSSSSVAGVSEDLFKSAKSGDIAKIKRLIKKGANVNTRNCPSSYQNALLGIGGNKDGGTALIVASTAGHLDVVKYLLSAGANVDDYCTSSPTALMAASEKNHLGIVKALLAKGAQVDLSGGLEMTSLMIAAGNGNIEIVDELIRKGADVNAEAVDGTPLSFASGVRTFSCTSGNFRIVKKLLATGAGAKINKTNIEGLNALMCATVTRSPDIFDALINAGADVNVNAGGLTALMHAASYPKFDNKDIVRTLLNKGAKVNDQNSYGVTAMMYAASRGRYDVVQELINRGADVNIEDKEGRTALMSAEGHAEIKELLIKAGGR